MPPHTNVLSCVLCTDLRTSRWNEIQAARRDHNWKIFSSHHHWKQISPLYCDTWHKKHPKAFFYRIYLSDVIIQNTQDWFSVQKNHPNNIRFCTNPGKSTGTEARLEPQLTDAIIKNTLCSTINTAYHSVGCSTLDRPEFTQQYLLEFGMWLRSDQRKSRSEGFALIIQLWNYQFCPINKVTSVRA